MSALKLKKSYWLRKRFVYSETLSDPNLWIDAAQALKQKIQNDSTFQIVEGDRGIVEIDEATKAARVLVEVVGVPQKGIPYLDSEQSDILIWDYPYPAFDVDFLTLINEILTVKRAIQEALEDRFLIVLKGGQISTSFFYSKRLY